jgi:hypothetical protein
MQKPVDCPENVNFLYMGLEQFNALSTSTLHVDIQIQRPFVYKICDLRPAFGSIFKDYLKQYEFWGYCDLDVIWGDIIGSLGTDVFAHYDIITSRVKRISGHFCLFRNTEVISNTYKWIPRVKKMMSSKKHFALDEDYLTDYLHVHDNPNWIVQLKQRFLGKQSVQPRVFWEKVLTTSGSHQRSMGDGMERCLRWKSGKAYDADGTEMMYLHFHKIKQTMSEINFGYGDRPQELRITRKGIFAP